MTTYVLKHEVRDTCGQLRGKTGDAVICKASSTPGYMHVIVPGLIDYAALLPASWVSIGSAK